MFIGAGPAGLTAAYKLSNEGIQVEIYEADNQVGGMAKTVEMGSISRFGTS